MLSAVSQFTLLASTKKGSRPDFHGAANGEGAKELYEAFYARIQELYDPTRVKDGVFKAMMQVGLVNDGPVGVDYRSEDGVVKLVNLYMIAIATIPTDAISAVLGDPRDPDKPSSSNEEG